MALTTTGDKNRLAYNQFLDAPADMTSKNIIRDALVKRFGVSEIEACKEVTRIVGDLRSWGYRIEYKD